MAKIDNVLEQVTDTRIAIGKIEEHLKALNGSVASTRRLSLKIGGTCFIAIMGLAGWIFIHVSG